MLAIHRGPTPVVVLSLTALACTTAPAAPEPVRASFTAPRAAARSAPVRAAESPVDTRDLAACLAHAREHSTRLANATALWRASAERPAQVGALPEPRLGWTEFVEEVQTRTGSQERRLGLSQAFPWPGTLGARAHVAEHEAEARAQLVDAVRRDVERDVAVAFHAYGFLGRELEITARRLELLRSFEPVVQTRVRAGAGQADLLRLQLEIGRLEDDLAAIERRRPAVAARLAEAMSLATEDALPIPSLDVPPALESGEHAGLDSEELVRHALATSPHLRALEAELDAHRAAETAAGKRRWPSFALGVDWFQTDARSTGGIAGNGHDPVALSLSISLPIWSASYRAAEHEARQRARASRARSETVESEMRAAIADEVARIDDAARRVGLFRATLIPRADEVLRLTLSDYRTGTVTLREVIEAERELLELDLASWRACRDYLQAEARLRALSGEVTR